MKKFLYLFLILILCVSFSFAQSKSKQKLTETKKLLAKREKFDPKRDPNLDLIGVIAKAQKENKRIILDVGGEWCTWCIKMDLFLMRNPKLDDLRAKNYIWVKINMSEENENKEFLSKYPEIAGYPHLFVLEKDGSLLKSQDTSEIEEPDMPIIIPTDVKDKDAFLKQEYEKRKARTYDLQKFTEFLKKWTPVSK